MLPGVKPPLQLFFMAEKRDAESLRIGNILTRQRLALKKEQGDLARVLGVTAVTIGRWERGLSKPELSRRADVEHAYGLSFGTIGGVVLHNTNVPRAVSEPPHGDRVDGLLEAAERMSQTVAGLIRDARVRRVELASDMAYPELTTYPALKVMKRTPATSTPATKAQKRGCVTSSRP